MCLRRCTNPSKPVPAVHSSGLPGKSNPCKNTLYTSPCGIRKLSISSPPESRWPARIPVSCPAALSFRPAHLNKISNYWSQKHWTFQATNLFPHFLLRVAMKPMPNADAVLKCKRYTSLEAVIKLQNLTPISQKDCESPHRKCFRRADRRLDSKLFLLSDAFL